MSQGAADWYIKKPMILAVLGTSLSAGRLSGNLWWSRLMENARACPEAVGPVILQNFGKGSQQSPYGVATAPEIAAFNPTHILAEDFSINNSAAALGVVTIPMQDADMQTMHDIWKAKNPAVDITWQSMNGVSAAGAALRPNLPDYYAAGKVKALAMGDRHLDHYNGLPSPPAPAGGWPKPLPEYMTVDNDGLHPLWDGSLEIYFWPGMIYWLRCRMAEWWGLPIPNPPDPPPIPDAQYLLAAGGGGGSGYYGGGAGGAGGVRRAATNLSNLMGPVFGGSGGRLGDNSGTNASLGSNGAPTMVRGFVALGGGRGGMTNNGAANNPGADGGSGGGGSGNNSGPTTGAGGNGTPGQGSAGAASRPSGTNGSGGGGGGKGGPGVYPPDNSTGSQGGPGWAVDVPGLTLTIAAGGPGGIYNGPRQPYLTGAGPSSIAGGGYGGTTSSTAGPGDNGGPGAAWVWYPGAARATGGTVWTYGGFTVHQFTYGSSAVSMTGPSSPAGNVASASSEYPGGTYPAWDAFDYVSAPGSAKGWISVNPATFPQWLKRRWTGAPKRWSHYAITGLVPAQLPASVVRDWVLQGSTNDVDWVTLDTRVNQTGWVAAERREYAIATPGEYEYYRLYVTANNGSPDHTDVALLEFYTQSDFPALMTADNLPAGNVASANNVFDGNYTAWRAFQDTDANAKAQGGWASAANVAGPYWLRRRWTGAPKRWIGYAMQAPDYTVSATWPLMMPKDWTIRGSNDGVNWTVLHTVVGEPGWASMERRVYDLTVKGSYEYYEILVTTLQGNDRQICHIGRLNYLPGLEPV